MGLVPPLTREEFASLIVEGIKKRGETREIKFDKDRFRLVSEGEPPLLIGHVRGIGESLPSRTVLALEKFYGQYCSLSISQRAEALMEYVKRWFILPTEPLDEMTRLKEMYQSASPDVKAALKNQFGESVDQLFGDPSGGTPSLGVRVQIDVPEGARVDGDSAGLTMMLAAISELSQVPMKRGIAVTGAINTYGDVLAVDFVNEKIEGWFRICKMNGLNGEQGVIIPKANVNDLQLDMEVVEAARRGLFHVYAVEKVDEAIEIMSELPAREVYQRMRDTHLGDQGSGETERA